MHANSFNRTRNSKTRNIARKCMSCSPNLDSGPENDRRSSLPMRPTVADIGGNGSNRRPPRGAVWAPPAYQARALLDGFAMSVRQRGDSHAVWALPNTCTLNPCIPTYVPCQTALPYLSDTESCLTGAILSRNGAARSGC